MKGKILAEILCQKKMKIVEKTADSMNCKIKEME